MTCQWIYSFNIYEGMLAWWMCGCLMSVFLLSSFIPIFFMSTILLVFKKFFIFKNKDPFLWLTSYFGLGNFILASLLMSFSVIILFIIYFVSLSGPSSLALGSAVCESCGGYLDMVNFVGLKLGEGCWGDYIYNLSGHKIMLGLSVNEVFYSMGWESSLEFFLWWFHAAWDWGMMMITLTSLFGVFKMIFDWVVSCNVKYSLNVSSLFKNSLFLLKGYLMFKSTSKKEKRGWSDLVKVSFVFFKELNKLKKWSGFQGSVKLFSKGKSILSFKFKWVEQSALAFKLRFKLCLVLCLIILVLVMVLDFMGF